MKTFTKTAIKTLAVSAGASCATYGVLTFIYEMLFNKKMELPTDISRKISGCDAEHLGEFLENNLRWVEQYGYERHFIISDRGERLTGYLLKAEGESDIYAFCAHGYRSYGKKEFAGVAQYYLSRGINVFFPDHIASGESEGNHCSFGFYEKEDCMKWLYYLNETFGENIRIFLHGVSMGSATVCMMSESERLPKNVKAIVSDCGYTTAAGLFEYKTAAMGVKATALIKAVNIAGKINHGVDLSTLEPVESVKNARVPMFFIHGRADGLVPCYMGEHLYIACGSEDKELMIIEDADHAQAYFRDAETYKARVGAFLDRVL